MSWWVWVGSSGGAQRLIWTVRYSAPYRGSGAKLFGDLQNTNMWQIGKPLTDHTSSRSHQCLVLLILWEIVQTVQYNRKVMSLCWLPVNTLHNCHRHLGWVQRCSTFDMKIHEKILFHYQSCDSPVDKEGFLYKKVNHTKPYIFLVTSLPYWSLLAPPVVVCNLLPIFVCIFSFSLFNCCIFMLLVFLSNLWQNKVLSYLILSLTL